MESKEDESWEMVGVAYGDLPCTSSCSKERNVHTCSAISTLARMGDGLGDGLEDGAGAALRTVRVPCVPDHVFKRGYGVSADPAVPCASACDATGVCQTGVRDAPIVPCLPLQTSLGMLHRFIQSTHAVDSARVLEASRAIASAFLAWRKGGEGRDAVSAAVTTQVALSRQSTLVSSTFVRVMHHVLVTHAGHYDESDAERVSSFVFRAAARFHEYMQGLFRARRAFRDAHVGRDALAAGQALLQALSDKDELTSLVTGGRGFLGEAAKAVQAISASLHRAATALVQWTFSWRMRLGALAFAAGSIAFRLFTMKDGDPLLPGEIHRAFRLHKGWVPIPPGPHAPLLQALQGQVFSQDALLQYAYLACLLFWDQTSTPMRVARTLIVAPALYSVAGLLTPSPPRGSPPSAIASLFRASIVAGALRVLDGVGAVLCQLVMAWHSGVSPERTLDRESFSQTLLRGVRELAGPAISAGWGDVQLFREPVALSAAKQAVAARFPGLDAGSDEYARALKGMTEAMEKTVHALVDRGDTLQGDLATELQARMREDARAAAAPPPPPAPGPPAPGPPESGVRGEDAWGSFVETERVFSSPPRVGVHEVLVKHGVVEPDDNVDTILTKVQALNLGEKGSGVARDAFFRDVADALTGSRAVNQFSSSATGGGGSTAALRALAAARMEAQASSAWSDVAHVVSTFGGRAALQNLVQPRMAAQATATRAAVLDMARSLAAAARAAGGTASKAEQGRAIVAELVSNGAATRGSQFWTFCTNARMDTVPRLWGEDEVLSAREFMVEGLNTVDWASNPELNPGSFNGALYNTTGRNFLLSQFLLYSNMDERTQSKTLMRARSKLVSQLEGDAAAAPAPQGIKPGTWTWTIRNPFQSATRVDKGSLFSKDWTRFSTYTSWTRFIDFTFSRALFNTGTRYEGEEAITGDRSPLEAQIRTTMANYAESMATINENILKTGAIRNPIAFKVSTSADGLVRAAV